LAGPETVELVSFREVCWSRWAAERVLQ